MALSHWGRLLLLAALCGAGLAACRGAGRPTSRENGEGAVLFEGQRWQPRHRATDDLLRPGYAWQGLLRWDERFACPKPETIVVRSPTGTLHAVRSVAALQPFLAPIGTPEAALRYARVLRMLPIPSADVPGLGRGTPERGGVIDRILEEKLRELGLPPEPQVEAAAAGFLIRRFVILPAEAGQAARLVPIEERVGRDGAYAPRVGAPVLEGQEVADLIWMAC